jgi:membrane-bound lytic murein transglycosylase MltF
MKRLRPIAGYFQVEARQYGFDWLLIAAMAYQESRLDQSLRSHTGAVGVMQIKPDIAA